MAKTDIFIQKSHSLAVDEVLQRLKPAMAKTAHYYGLQMEWSGNICRFNGPALGLLKVQPTLLIVAAQLGLVARQNRREIELEIHRVLDAVVG